MVRIGDNSWHSKNGGWSYCASFQKPMKVSLSSEKSPNNTFIIAYSYPNLGTSNLTFFPKRLIIFIYETTPTMSCPSDCHFSLTAFPNSFDSNIYEEWMQTSDHNRTIERKIYGLLTIRRFGRNAVTPAITIGEVNWNKFIFWKHRCSWSWQWYAS